MSSSSVYIVRGRTKPQEGWRREFLVETSEIAVDMM